MIENTTVVDVRGFEPPQPLVLILEALAKLAPGQALQAHTDRRPLHLEPLLRQRGCAWTITEQDDGSFITNIRLS
jgi:TusA-related sulfurtransferase